MTTREKQVGLKLLSALAWADEKLTERELESLVEFVSAFGPWEGREIKDSLRSHIRLTPELLVELDVLSSTGLADVLAYGWDMVNAERPATENELAILREASAARLGEGAWERVQEWLAARRRVAELERDLFERDARLR